MAQEKGCLPAKTRFYFKHLEQCLTHARCSINIYGLNEQGRFNTEGEGTDRSGLVTPGELAKDRGGIAMSLNGPSILKQDTSQWLEYWERV